MSWQEIRVDVEVTNSTALDMLIDMIYSAVRGVGGMHTDATVIPLDVIPDPNQIPLF